MNSSNGNKSNSLSALYSSSSNNSGNTLTNNISNASSSLSTSLGNSLSSLYKSNSTSNSTSNSNTSGGIFEGIIGFFSNISWITWFIIIIILTILGINIFRYLAEGTQFTANIVETISKWFSTNVGSEIVDTVKQTAHVSAVGVSATADSIADASDPVKNTNNTVTAQQASSSQSPDIVTTQSPTYPTTAVDNSLNKSLNNAIEEVQADDSYSSIQRSKGADKSGWCFIGEDKGIRSCVEVGPNDKCMSGDIFPTSAVCVNPNLRV